MFKTETRQRGRPRKPVHVVTKEYTLRKERCSIHGNNLIVRYVYETGRDPSRSVFCRACQEEEAVFIVRGPVARAGRKANREGRHSTHASK